jgi:hypothetical protein
VSVTGHSKPFTLHFIEIGNEDEFDKAKTYDIAFLRWRKVFVKNIHAARAHIGN